MNNIYQEKILLQIVFMSKVLNLPFPRTSSLQVNSDLLKHKTII